VHVEAKGAAIDLRGAQLHEVQRGFVEVRRDGGFDGIHGLDAGSGQ